MTSTPWGTAQHTEYIAKGIVFYITAGHGGFKLSPERIKELPDRWKDFIPFAGPSWYEEDCDWAIIVTSFPQYFKEEEVKSANELIENYAEYFAKEAITA